MNELSIVLLSSYYSIKQWSKSIDRDKELQFPYYFFPVKGLCECLLYGMRWCGKGREKKMPDEGLRLLPAYCSCHHQHHHHHQFEFFSWFLSLSLYSIFYKLVPPKTGKKIVKVFFIYFKLYNIRVYGYVRGNLGAHYFEAEKVCQTDITCGMRET